MNTLSQNYKLISLLHPIAVTADTNHTGVTIEEYENDGMVAVDLGAVTGTTPTLDLKIQVSKDGGTTWEDALTFAQVTSGNKVAAGYVQLNHVTHVRAVSDVGGTTPSFTMSIALLVEAGKGGEDVNSTTFA
jgi:hypothetical protein